MNYFELFEIEYKDIQMLHDYTIETIVLQIKQLFAHEWIEEIDMIYYREKVFSMSIEEILDTMPQLNWSKLAYETIKRRAGSCCHFSALLSAIVSIQGISNSIAVGSCVLTKGRYSGKHGIHYWNKLELNNSIINIDLCDNNPIFYADEYIKRNIVLHHEIHPFFINYRDFHNR